MKIIFIKVQPHPNGYGFQRPNPPDPNIVSGYRKLFLFFYRYSEKQKEKDRFWNFKECSICLIELRAYNKIWTSVNMVKFILLFLHN